MLTQFTDEGMAERQPSAIALRAASEAIAPKQRLADVAGTAQLIALWLHGKTSATQKSYEHDVRLFAAFILGMNPEQVQLNDLDLRTITLNDVQAYADYQEVIKGHTPASRKRRLCAIKSLLRFGYKVQYLSVNVGEVLETPSPGKNILAERILTEMEIATMIALTTNPRDRLLLRFLYATGARVGEVALLTWRDIQANRDGKGQATLFGKGGKTRTIIITADLYADLQALSPDAAPDTSVFRSRKGGTPLKVRQIENVITEAAKRAGIKGKVSPHWLRHSHASHSLDRGCPPQLLQQSLGHASLDTTSRYAHARPNESSSLYLMPTK